MADTEWCAVKPRVHVVTVHWKTPAWIELQQRQLAKSLADVQVSLHLGVGGGVEVDDPPVMNHAGLDGFNVVSVAGRHAENLDGIISGIAGSTNDDLLMVLDQDAFPVGPLGPSLQQTLTSGNPLAAVRTENGGDAQPHPLFFLCRLSLWRSIGGTWREGPVRLSDNAARRDVGGVLLRQLHDAGRPWVRLNRSADTRLHPVLYGLYGDLIYHHGAASRPVWTESDARRIYSNIAVRALDGLLYRMPFSTRRSRRYQEEGRMADGHKRQTEALFRDPESFVQALKPLDMPTE